eukprot:12035678-Alexandrium_andersonii.AAC.1
MWLEGRLSKCGATRSRSGNKQRRSKSRCQSHSAYLREKGEPQGRPRAEESLGWYGVEGGRLEQGHAGEPVA